MNGSVPVETTFCWSTFVQKYWDRSPVLFRSPSLSPAPFAAGDVFRAAVHGSRSARLDGHMPSHAQFTVERTQRDVADDLLPAAEDGSFDGYDSRLATRLDGRRHALVINSFHTFDPALWSRERTFFAGLWDIVGLPLTGAITTLFHGTYEHSPVGVHKDRFATFMFGLRGRKRMRFWSHRPWDEPVSTKVDYADHRSESFAAEIGPGDVLYWPADYYHVGESATTAPATSVNVGVPRHDHHVGYELETLIADIDPNRLTGGSSLDTLLPCHEAPVAAAGPRADGLLSAALPEGFSAPVRTLHTFAKPDRMADRVTTVSLRRWTAGGFEPAPAPVSPPPLADTDLLRADPHAQILWARDSKGSTLCAANGHHTTTPLKNSDMLQLTEALTSTRPAEVAALLEAVSPGLQRGAARTLLQQLESFGAVRRHS